MFLYSVSKKPTLLTLSTAYYADSRLQNGVDNIYWKVALSHSVTSRRLTTLEEFIKVYTKPDIEARRGIDFNIRLDKHFVFLIHSVAIEDQPLEYIRLPRSRSEGIHINSKRKKAFYIAVENYSVELGFVRKDYLKHLSIFDADHIHLQTYLDFLYTNLAAFKDLLESSCTCPETVKYMYHRVLSSKFKETRSMNFSERFSNDKLQVSVESYLKYLSKREQHEIEDDS